MSSPRWNTPPLTLAMGPFRAVIAGVGVGKSFGSRGSRTYTAPPASKTAANVAPIEQSMSDRHPATTIYNVRSPAKPTGFSLFGEWQGLLVGGVIASGLGSVFGLGDAGNGLDLLLLCAVIAAGIYMVLNFFNDPSSARTDSSGMSARSDTPKRLISHFNNSAVMLADALAVREGDLDTFERLLGEIQTAYSRDDTDALGARATPEMFSHFSQELYDNAMQGLRNEVSDIKLLQADVSEAWSENGSDYATIAMRYSMINAIVQTATGEVTSGDRNQASETIELWTFRRDGEVRTDSWELSAIQQGI